MKPAIAKLFKLPLAVGKLVAPVLVSGALGAVAGFYLSRPIMLYAIEEPREDVVVEVLNVGIRPLNHHTGRLEFRNSVKAEPLFRSRYWVEPCDDCASMFRVEESENLCALSWNDPGRLDSFDPGERLVFIVRAADPTQPNRVVAHSISGAHDVKAYWVHVESVDRFRFVLYGCMIIAALFVLVLATMIHLSFTYLGGSAGRRSSPPPAGTA